MRFDEPIEYNMRNLFLENSYTKCESTVESFARLFLLYAKLRTIKKY